MTTYEILSVVFKTLSLPALYYAIYCLGRCFSYLESSGKEPDKNKNENKE